MKLNNKGFTLVELLLAVAISTIVFGSITSLMIYASKSSKLTNEKVMLQEEVKDAMNHIESYCMEAEAASHLTVGGSEVLVLFQRRADLEQVSSSVSGGAVDVSKVKDIGSAGSGENSYAYAYWWNGSNIYFGKCSHDGDIDLTALPAENEYLLASNVAGFTCEVNQNPKSKKYSVDIGIDGEINASKYSSNRTIYIRNQ